MPNLTFPKSALEPRPNFQPGRIQVMFTGFKPQLSKKKEGKEQSINMNPVLTVVNDSRSFPDGKPYNGSKVFDSLNLSFLPRVQDFVHAFGCAMTESGDNVDLPGYFDGDTANPDPKNWGQYHGPLLNEVAELELKEVADSRPGAKPTDKRVEIDRYICRVAGCDVKHMETLIRS